MTEAEELRGVLRYMAAVAVACLLGFTLLARITPTAVIAQEATVDIAVACPLTPNDSGSLQVAVADQN